MIGYCGLQHEHKPVSSSKEGASENLGGVEKSAEKKAQWWTCSMHPQIRLPHPGKCPICFMELIPVASEDGGADIKQTQYSMSEEAKKLAQVETTVVKREPAKVTVRMVGLVYEDETRVASLTSRIDGRLDEIYINFTGVQVKQGDPMVKIWSPTLIKSQVELFESIRSGDDPNVIKGAEEKLIQYGLTQKQVDEIKEKRKPNLYITLRAPISGIVTKKMAILGQFTKEGSEMYTINDLSHVWVKLDAYELDLPWIKYGQDVSFTTPSIPGKTFKGKVLFIDPVLDTKTRSVKVRVDAENPGYLLKPGMFVSAEVESEVDSKGKVIKSEWTGKYICPIHPRDEGSPSPGVCPDSNLELRPAASYGYSDEIKPQLPLAIPASAPLITGTRTIVYVEVPGSQPTYELREVVLGPRAGNDYVVYEGLKEGERVVTRGNFKIDSAMQILGRSSMMSPEPEKKHETKPEKKADEEVIAKLVVPHEFLQTMTPVIEEYFSLKDALVAENPSWVGLAAEEMGERIAKISKESLKGKALDTWNKLSAAATSALKSISDNRDLAAQRSAFDNLSESFAKLVMTFRHAMDAPIYLYFCQAAASGNGAYWLEQSQEFKNPYLVYNPRQGQENCGQLEETIPPEPSEPNPAAESLKPGDARVPGSANKTSVQPKPVQ